MTITTRTMKIITNLLIGAICTSLTTTCSAKYISDTTQLQSGAASVGYAYASVLWDQGKYKCSKSDDVILNFWPQVTRVVYNQCSNTYALWASDAAMCTNGAETFVTDMADSCINQAEDCGMLADTAAKEVSAVFCFPQSINKQKKHYFSRDCRNAAKSICQNLVVDYVKQLVDKGKCAGRRYDGDEDDLDSNCITVVDRLSETAALPTEPCAIPYEELPTQDELEPPEDDPYYDEPPYYPGDNDGVNGGTFGGDNPQLDPNYKPSHGKKDPTLYVFNP